MTHKLDTRLARLEAARPDVDLMVVGVELRDDGTLADPTPAQLARATAAHARRGRPGYDYQQAIAAIAAPDVDVDAP